MHKTVDKKLRMTATVKYLIIILFCITFDIAAQDKNINYKDTINIIDATDKKQGYWIVWGQSKPKTCYKPDQKVEEGFYKDNKKTGVWSEYFCNGIKKNKITFTNGVPIGPATIYYDDGKIAEEGTWQVKDWVGKYKLYSRDGTFKEYLIDDKGNKNEVGPLPKSH